jgi:hypothetical protein
MVKKNEQRFVNRIVNYVQGLSTSELNAILGLVWIVLLYLDMQIADIQNRENYNILDTLLISLAFYIAGCGGLVNIIRQELELPLGHKLRGTLAIVAGTLKIVLAWGLATFFLVIGLS